MRFVCAKAEDAIGGIMVGGGGGGTSTDGRGDEIVAVVDPARTGLKPAVCRALRARADVRRVVFVSCNPHGHNMRWDFTVKNGSLLDNALVLCGPSDDGSAPFRPAYACAVAC